MLFSKKKIYQTYNHEQKKSKEKKSLICYFKAKQSKARLLKTYFQFVD